ncbi:MAG: RidA family protein [Pseudorhodoplanes sp.]
MPEIEVIKVEGLYEVFSPHAIRHNGVVYVSGCVPLDKDKKLVGRGDLAEQTRKTLANLELVLKAAGTDFSHLLKTTVFLTDISKKPLCDAVRREIFASRPPASTAVEVKGLGGDGIMIELDAIAAMPSR